jgi:hypothetical protein
MWAPAVSLSASSHSTLPGTCLQDAHPGVEHLLVNLKLLLNEQ